MIQPLGHSSDATLVVPRQHSEDWRVDDEGVLHTGRSVPFAEHIVIACDNGVCRP